ncbi:MAG: hypothetical protein KDA30_15265, partial [Phycisphaerales bacterium]|nr:hypothetical protein [Phycisphaerales bacterium]
MDDRQKGIEIGAGLQESRLNEDFIQFLQKWGPRALYTLAIVVGLWAGYQYYQRWQADKTDQAFQELSDARGALLGEIFAGSPDALLAIAEKYPTRAAVAIQARLDAADIYAVSARRGVFPGGDYNNDDDRLSPEEMKNQNERAKSLYEQVIAEVGGKDRLNTFALTAYEGLFSAELNLGNWPEARSAATKALEIAEKMKLHGRARMLRDRLESVDGLGKLAQLPTNDELPESARMKKTEPIMPVPSFPEDD